MKTSIYSWAIALGMIVFSSSNLNAACPHGKVAVFISTPSGITKEICVSEKAIEGINVAEGHSSTIRRASLDISGFWIVSVLAEGELFTDAPMHMTVSQTGSDTVWIPTCDGGSPAGSGTISGTSIVIVFETGDGGTATASGEVSGDTMSGTYTLGDGGGTWSAVRSTDLDCGAMCNPIEVVQFVDTDIYDLNMVWRISKFRSGAGHDYSDMCESCRSMKHYIQYPDEFRANDLVEVRSPVNGTIVKIDIEQHGFSGGLVNRLVTIRSSVYPDYYFLLHHVDLASDGISLGAPVAAGDRIGTAHIWYPEIPDLGYGFDVGAFVVTPYGKRYISYFETMTDSLFASYVARGVSSRSDLIITKEERDASPLTCNADETFVEPDIPGNYFFLEPIE